MSLRRLVTIEPSVTSYLLWHVTTVLLGIYVPGELQDQYIHKDTMSKVLNQQD